MQSIHQKKNAKKEMTADVKLQVNKLGVNIVFLIHSIKKLGIVHRVLGVF